MSTVVKLLFNFNFIQYSFIVLIMCHCCNHYIIYSIVLYDEQLMQSKLSHRIHTNLLKHSKLNVFYVFTYCQIDRHKTREYIYPIHMLWAQAYRYHTNNKQIKRQQFDYQNNKPHCQPAILLKIKYKTLIK